MLDVNFTAQSGKTPLCYAATFGDPNAIESLINCGADFNVKDANGSSPLQDAVIGDNPRAIEVLLSKGAQVDVQNFTGSPLLLATLLGHISCMKVLLAHNADPNELLCGVMMPLLIALMNNEKCTFHPPNQTKEIVELLIKARADVNKIPVLSLAYHSRELMEYLLESGADPNLPDEVIEEDSENASVYYAKRCLCGMHLGNAMHKMTGFKFMINATIDADSSKMSEVIHTLGLEHFSEMISFQMLLKLPWLEMGC